MKSSFLPLLIVLLGSVNLACDEDDFSQVVEVNLPAHESKIVLFSRFAGGQNSIHFNLSNTLSILDTSDYSTMKEATVHLYINGTLISSVGSAQGFMLRLDKPLPFSPEVYEIKAEAPGYPPIQARQTMPGKVDLASATLLKNGAITQDGRFDEVTLEFLDPATQENYYLPRCLYGYQFLDGNNKPAFHISSSLIDMESIDPLLEDAYTQSGRIASDKTFNGRLHKMKLYFNSAKKPKPDPNLKMIKDSESFGFQLVTITKEGYLYWRSLAKYQQSKDNPFAEPVVIYSNIENGRGAFFLEAYGNVIWKKLE